MDPLSATDARRRDTWLKDVWFSNPSKGRATWEVGGIWCSWPDTRRLDKGYVSGHFHLTLSVNGQTLEGIIGEANLSSMEQPESTKVLSVTPTSPYSMNSHIQGMLVTFLVDTGSIISIMKTTVWTQPDPNRQQLNPYQDRQLVDVEETPLSV